MMQMYVWCNIIDTMIYTTHGCIDVLNIINTLLTIVKHIWYSPNGVSVLQYSTLGGGEEGVSFLLRVGIGASRYLLTFHRKLC